MMTTKYLRRLLAALTTAVVLAFSALPALALDVNTATAEELQTLTGIGPQKAEAIVAYREKNGPFKSTAGLLEVPGIGPATVAKNRGQWGLDDATSPPSE